MENIQVTDEQYVSLELAKLAKEKGLDFELDLGGNCVCYNNEGRLLSYHVHFQYPDRKEYIFAPTQSQLAKVLRDNVGIQVYAYSSTTNGLGEYKDYVVYINGAPQNDSRDGEYKTYEEAMEFGLFTAIRNL